MWCLETMNHELIFFLRFENVRYLQNPTCNKGVKVAGKKTLAMDQKFMFAYLYLSAARIS